MKGSSKISSVKKNMKKFITEIVSDDQIIKRFL